MSKVVNIEDRQQCIDEINPEILYEVSVLVGAPNALVAHRELRGHYVGKSRKARKLKSEQYYEKRTEGYQTNRSIKVWACYFLLKSMTTSGKISRWTDDKELILTWCQCNENTFRRHLAAMVALKLCTVNRITKSITLVSFERAAEILDIPFEGTIKLQYNPYIQNGKQVFQFIIRAEEFRSEQQRQLDALMYHLDNNPSLKNDLQYMLMKEGAEIKRLSNAVYFQSRLLELQKRLFKEGSELLSYVFSRRADINRSVNLVKDHHKYKSAQSVSYLKKRMHDRKLITVTKVKVESAVKSRLYINDYSLSPSGAGGRRGRDGYKWVAHKQPSGLTLGGHTVWFLCDQIAFNYSTIQTTKNEKAKKKAA